MFCPKCGKINPDNSEICSGCNASLITQTPKKPVKKRNWLKTALIVVAVLAVVAVIAFLLGGCGNITVPEESMTF